MSDLGNKAVMAENIKYYMNLHNKTRAEVCKDLGFAYSTFSEWLNAKKYPRIDKIEMMANYFHISKADLVERQDSDRKSFPHRKGVKIPVLGRVVAGVPVDAVEEILDYEEITPELATTGDFFALQIRGRSMEPRMLDGDVVIVRRQNDVDSGDTAIVLVNGDDATVKRISKSDKGISLIATNPNVYEPHFYTNEEIESLPVQILGKVIELRGKF